MQRTYHDSVVQIHRELAHARAPSGLPMHANERSVLEGTYRSATTPMEYDCIVKQLHRPLTRTEVGLKLTRLGSLVTNFSWTKYPAHPLGAKPLAAVPVDYCRADGDDRYDGAVLT